jgi:hypothetical protein
MPRDPRIGNGISRYCAHNRTLLGWMLWFIGSRPKNGWNKGRPQDVLSADYETAQDMYAILDKAIEDSPPKTLDPVRAALGIYDRFYLLTRLLGRPDANVKWLYERCRDCEADPFDHLDLWARYHYKSTFITFAHSIQSILADPEITIGIFSATSQVATPFLEQIKDEFEKNETLKELYPDVLYENPRQDSPTWSKNDGIVVKRAGNPKEKTVEAFGLVEGMPPGRHFKRLVYDDLVTEKLVTSPEMIQKVTTRWELSDNLGCGEGTEKLHIGTRYDFADTYGIIMSRGILTPRIFPATKDGTLNGEPVFLSPEHWAKVKNTQRTTVAAQMLQNPLAGKQNTFMPQWLRGYIIRPSILNVYIMVDPSRGKSATSDRTAMAVVGVDGAGNKYLLDGYCHRMSLSERWRNMRGLWLKWNGARGVAFVKVGYERYGQQSDDEYFQEKMREPGEIAQFGIEELAWPREGGNSKKHRVERLQPDAEHGRLWLPGLIRENTIKEDRASGDTKAGNFDCFWAVDEKDSKLTFTPMQGLTKDMRRLKESGQEHRIVRAIVRKDEDDRPYDVTRRLIEEMLFFPFAPHDDLIDAVSRIYDMKPISAGIGEGKEAEELNEQDWVDA